MQYILDDFNEKNIKRNIFSKLAFIFGLLTIALLISLAISFPSKIKVNEGIPIFITQLIMAIQMSCLFGVLFSIISVIRKERLKYIKITGILLNFLIVIILIGLAIFARVVN